MRKFGSRAQSSSAASPRRPPPRPAPDAGSLHAAALTYLSRFAATESGLTQVLRRKVDRWARAAEGEGETIAAQASLARDAIAGIVVRLVEAGAVSDAAFAVSRARSLSRAGRGLPRNTTRCPACSRIEAHMLPICDDGSFASTLPRQATSGSKVGTA